jgi:Protein of unknown function (DUF1549)/Protein of unknown function (DUF1553)
MSFSNRTVRFGFGVALTLVAAVEANAANNRSKSVSPAPADSPAVAADVDRLILSDLKKAGVTPADRCNDADFLRRVSLDITGQLPSPRDVTIFVLDPDSNKRAVLIDQLLRSPEYGTNWARYWRDVVYMPATDNRSRFSQAEFEKWMADELNADRGWDRIVTAMLTASGNVKENPATALLFAQGAQAPEIAAESCRIFLGIQMQCANCHDHPSDVWKRDQFHELAAYFPRMALRQMQEPRTFEIVSVNTDRGRGDFMRENPERFISMLDRNGDKKLSKEEMKNRPGMAAAMPAQFLDRIFELGDTDKDGALTVAELKALPVPDQARRGSTEHYMPDLNDPSSKGKLVEPKFFVDQTSPGHGLSDEDRRAAVAKSFTSPDNPWFAKAIVNRIWCEFLGEGFYMPVDDLGPTRTARFPEAIDVLAAGFVSNKCDVKWLMRTIANSQTYQRKVAAKAVSEDALPFASVTPTRLRADLVFNSLFQVLGIDEAAAASGRGMMMGGPFAIQRSPRFQFDFLFGVDPSVPKEDITGNVPQSLFLMNSNSLRFGLSANGNSRLAKILRENKDDRDALSELYLLVLSREPSKHDEEICLAYLKKVGQRGEAYEDLLWSLLNSSEFLSKR